MTSKEVAKAEPMLPAVAAAAAMQESLREVLAPGETLGLRDLPSMKLPSGTSTSWELPDGSPVKTVQAAILHRQPFRSYWKGSFDDSGGGEPPDCSSMDMLMGHGDNGTGEGDHDCLTCPLSAFGTGDGGRGKACRELSTLYLLHESSGMPISLRLGVTSTPEAKGYAIRTGGGFRSVTELALVTKTSVQGIPYPVVTFKELRPLSEEEQAVVTGMRAAMLPFFQRRG